nr:MAG TPA: hypothetical protein [Caudoviricetes sp.]
MFLNVITFHYYFLLFSYYFSKNYPFLFYISFFANPQKIISFLKNRKKK